MIIQEMLKTCWRG